MAPFIAVANQELLAKFFHINNDQSLENIQITNDFNIEFVEPYNVQTHYVHPVLLVSYYVMILLCFSSFISTYSKMYTIFVNFKNIRNAKLRENVKL